MSHRLPAHNNKSLSQVKHSFRKVTNKTEIQVDRTLLHEGFKSRPAHKITFPLIYIRNILSLEILE